MSTSRPRKRHASNMIKKSPSPDKKIRKPLKCKKNTVQTVESRKYSSNKYKSVEKNMYCEINEKSSSQKILRSSLRLSSLSPPEKNSVHGKNSLSPKFKIHDSIEIDALSTCKTFNKKLSVVQSQKSDHTGLLIDKENSAKLKSLNYKKKLDKLSDISPFMQNGSPRKGKRQSFYRKSSSINDYCDNPKSQMQLSKRGFKMSTPRISEMQVDSLKLRNSTVLRSTPKNKETSRDVVLSNGPDANENRMSSTVRKDQQTKYTKKTRTLSSKSGKAFVQKNKKRNLISKFIEKPVIDVNHTVPEAVESFTHGHPSRSSGILQARSSSGKTVEKNAEGRPVSRFILEPGTDVNCKTPKNLEKSTSLSSSMILRISPSSESSRNRIPLRIRCHSEKASNNLLSDEVPHSAVREKIKLLQLGTDINCITPKNVEKSTSSSMSSIILRTRPSSEEPSRNRIPLRIRCHSEKASNNLLSDEVPHSAAREKNKKCPLMSKKQKKKNVKPTNKRTSLVQKDTEMQSKNNKDLQTLKRIPLKSPKSSPRKSSRLLTEKKSKEIWYHNSRVRECKVTLTDINKQKQTEKSAVLPKRQKTEVKMSAVLLKRQKAEVKKSAISPTKQKAEDKGKRSARKRLLSSPAITPFVKKRKLSVHFKKQSRPRSFSAVIPIDDLALTPAAVVRRTKSDGYKFPGKNTLKRKRFVMEEIKKADDDYEDDIYESRTFDHFKDMFPDSSDSSELSCPIKTPKLASLLTPGIHCKTPAYKDCYSPSEYALQRKIAEEYMYRTRKIKRASQVETPNLPEKKKLEFNKVVEKACAVQKEVEKLTAEPSDEEEDLYFAEDI